MENKIKDINELLEAASILNKFDILLKLKENDLYDLAIEWFEKLAVQTQNLEIRDKALLQLLDIKSYVDGYKDTKRVKEILAQKSDKERHPDFVYWHGNHILNETGPFYEKITEGMAKMELAAELGSVQAYVALGKIYTHELFEIEMDYKKGMNYLKKASDLGDKEATLHLANCYYNKKENFYDIDLAYKLFLQLSKAGNSFAKTRVEEIKLNNLIR